MKIRRYTHWPKFTIRGYRLIIRLIHRLIKTEIRWKLWNEFMLIIILINNNSLLNLHWVLRVYNYLSIIVRRKKYVVQYTWYNNTIVQCSRTVYIVYVIHCVDVKCTWYIIRRTIYNVVVYCSRIVYIVYDVHWRTLYVIHWVDVQCTA